MQVGSISGASPYMNTVDGSIRAKERISEQVQEDSRIKESQKQQEQDANVAVNVQSAQGDNLKVTQEGMQSVQAGGTIRENSEDGVVARKDDISVTTNTDAAKILKEQIEKAREKAEEDRDSRADEAKEPANTQSQVNLIGKTKEQIEQLYQRGDISRYEYDRKMEESEDKLAKGEQAADEQGELVKEVTSGQEKIMENKALFDAVENGNQDVMAAAVNLGKIE